MFAGDLLAQATSPDTKGALYGAVALVLTTTIGGLFAYATARATKASEPKVVYRDPPTTHALPAEMSDLFAQERDRLTTEIAALNEAKERIEDERDMWMERAYQKGYKST